jgi:hypothetical protein
MFSLLLPRSMVMLLLVVVDALQIKWVYQTENSLCTVV